MLKVEIKQIKKQKQLKNIFKYYLVNISNETEKLFVCYQKARIEKFFLSSQAERILEDFFRDAGTFSKTMEEVHLDRTIERLLSLEHEETKAFQKDKKLSFTLGLCASFGVVMILI